MSEEQLKLYEKMADDLDHYGYPTYAKAIRELVKEIRNTYAYLEDQYPPC